MGAGDPALYRDLFTTASGIAEMDVEWRRLNENGLTPVQEARAPIYDRTTRFRVYEPGVLPGLVQTAAYARALMGRIVAFYGIPDDAEQAGAPSSGGLTWVGEPARAAAGMGTREIAPGPGSSGWPPLADLSG